MILDARRATLVLLALALAAAAPVLAEGAPVLDGRLDEDFWAQADALEVETIEVPDFEPPGRRPLAPTVRVRAADGHLWIGVTADEPPGPGIGVAFLLAPEGESGGAADALAVAYAPQAVGAPRWVVHGPRGVGRDAYRVRGATDVREPGRWSLEVAVPFADLDLPDATTALRLGVAVKTRNPNLVAWAPPDAAFAGPAAWTRLDPPGAWPLEGQVPDARVLSEEDLRDEERLQAFSAFVQAYRAALGDLLQAAGHEDGLTPDTKDETVLAALRSLLVEPLERVSALRPDLAFAHVLRGGVLSQMGLADEAREAFLAANRIAPGLREAVFGIEVELLGPALAQGPVGAATDYETAFAAAARAAEAAEGPLARDGVAFGRGLLHLSHGDFAEAVALLQPLADRYPFHQAVVYAAERARRGRETMPLEARYRELEAERDDLPRVRLSTTKGDVLLELFEDDAANTVESFVWLVSHGFYDDVPIDRTVPFLGVQAGEKDPGYRIPTLRPPDTRRPGSTDARRRRPFRGTIAMLSPVPDAAAARFLLLTGTATDLDGDLLPFGRVVDGQSAVEALQAGDRILEAVVVRTRERVEYRPLTVEGEPAPEPR